MKKQRRSILNFLLCSHLLWNLQCSNFHSKTDQAQKKRGQFSAQRSVQIYGVTVDSIAKLPEIVEALRQLPRKPTVRIVFDKLPADDYKEAVHQIHKVSFVMGELVDSAAMKSYKEKDFQQRAAQYLDILGDEVDIWEIGNEVNGEWSGKTSDVVKKMNGAFRLAQKKGTRTALTLFYNDGCWKMPSEEMFQWAEKNVPAEMKEKLDFVFVSYYEEECSSGPVDWVKVFNRLGEMFPNSKIGFGEIGTKTAERKDETIRKYYSLKVPHPRYVGGYFWWYFADDMIPVSKHLWNVLNETLRK